MFHSLRAIQNPMIIHIHIFTSNFEHPFGQNKLRNSDKKRDCFKVTFFYNKTLDVLIRIILCGSILDKNIVEEDISFKNLLEQV